TPNLGKSKRPDLPRAQIQGDIAEPGGRRIGARVDDPRLERAAPSAERAEDGAGQLGACLSVEAARRPGACGGQERIAVPLGVLEYRVRVRRPGEREAARS